MYQNVRSKLFRNIYFVLLYRLLIILFLFSLCRVGFYLFNASYFEGISFARFLRIMQGGVLFDISAIVYTNLLIIVLHILPLQIRYQDLYQKVLKYIFYVFNGISLAANCADFVYYPFTLKRTTASAFDQFKHEENLFSLFLKILVDYWYAVLFFAALVALMVFLYKRLRPVNPGIRNPYLRVVIDLTFATLVIALSVGGGRGGFRHSTRPITLSNAGKYVETPDEMALVLNTPFCIYRTSEQESLKTLDYFTDQEELSGIYTPVHMPSLRKGMKKMNVVIFILESFATEYIGTFNRHLEEGKYKGFTPFMDSLMQDSRVFWYSFANGRKSIDALPSVISSIPSVNQHFILSHYSSNKVTSMARLLRDKGYRTAFFHGAPNGSMGFDAYANLAGFDQYFGKDEYGNNADFDGLWGVWDEEFFQFFAHTLDTFPEPFFSTIFSVSSHHPFSVPDRYVGKFPEGPLELHKCIAYTDYSLKRFFETASQMPWFDSTLFVFTADHASVIHYPEYRTLTGYFRVPIVFYQPGRELKGIDYRVAQQIDILPSVLHYLGYDEPFLAFGQDLFDSDTTRMKFAVNYMFETSQFISGEYALHFDGQKVIGLYRYREDRLLEENLAGLLPEVEEAMLTTLKAFLQQYNNRMIGDSLVVGTE